MRISISELERLQQEGKIRGFTQMNKGAAVSSDPKKSKYGNQKVEIDGREFGSQKEANRYMVLKYRQGMGEIKNLCCQVKFTLDVNDEKVASYIADFVYEEKGKMIVEDVKSKITRKIGLYRLKKKLMLQIYKIEIKET